MKLGMNERRKRARILFPSFSVALIMLIQSLTPSFASSFSTTHVERALESAVRIEITLTWPKQAATFTGSGWTRSCVPQDKTYRLIVATAGNVIVSALPSPLWTLTPAQYLAMEVTQMGFLESLIPVLKLGGLAAVAASLVHSTIALLHLGPKFSQETFDMIMAVSQTAVNAVEQAHGDLASIDKKQLARQMVSEILTKLGINAPPSLIDAGIESAVLALNHVFGRKVA